METAHVLHSAVKDVSQPVTASVSDAHDSAARHCGHIGKVVGSAGAGLRHRPVGKAQAWYYPIERTVVLWECFFERAYAKPDSTEDPNLVAMWTGFERLLARQFPAVVQLVTTHADPLYETPAYQRFLVELGYRQVNNRAFGKVIPQPDTHANDEV